MSIKKMAIKDLIEPTRLKSIYRRIKAEPKRVFLSSDFKPIGTRFVLRHLRLLVQLELVEQVVAVYYVGKHRQTKLDTKGFRFRR